MSLRKTPTLTPALLAANRRNAKMSTGPPTAWGKAQSRMNGVRQGGRSPVFRNLLRALLEAPPCAVNATARAVLTPEQGQHPLFAEVVEIAREAEIAIAENIRLARARREKRMFTFLTGEAGMLLKIQSRYLECLNMLNRTHTVSLLVNKQLRINEIRTSKTSCVYVTENKAS